MENIGHRQSREGSGSRGTHRRERRADRHQVLSVECLEDRLLLDVKTLTPLKDNTLIESATGSLSNGGDASFFVGRTVQTSGGAPPRGCAVDEAECAVRRGVIAFDIAGNIPAGATINSVTLKLRMSKDLGAQAWNIELHRLLAGWGEGTADGSRGGGLGAAAAPGDATWLYKSFDTSTWATPGGDFAGTTSASQSVAGVGDYLWGSTPQMVADVQSWLDTPSSNSGWS